MKHARYPNRATRGAPWTEAEDAALTDAELRQRIARDAGLLAYRIGDDHAFRVLCRIAGALGQPNGGRA